jgi:L-aminopeptidase/D-esterase-like protein
LAEAANDAVGGAVRPAHTLFDGDAVFSLATKQVAATYVDVAALVEEAVTTAVRRAVQR